jgi:hypothetical protein
VWVIEMYFAQMQVDNGHKHALHTHRERRHTDRNRCFVINGREHQ